MKPKSRWMIYPLPALLAGFGLMLTGVVTAQTFKNLYIFTGGSDGSNPSGGVILSGNTLYGTADAGGISGRGTVYKLNTDGTGLTILHSFTATTGSLPTNSDGAGPSAGLLLSSNTLYGTARYGGRLGAGAVFRVNTDGTGFTNLYNFTGGNDGDYPAGGVILSDSTLYGTTENGGNSDSGTVFAMRNDGTGFTNLHRFTALAGPMSTNRDGVGSGSLILSGNILFGMASRGGTSGNGTVYKLNTDGTGFTNLHTFTATVGSALTNSDGASPFTGLILSGNVLYGTARRGGSSGNGTIFKVSANGTGFTILHSFTALSGPLFTNSNGAHPLSRLMLSGNTLFGTTHYGGTSGKGTVYQINTDGTGFTNLHSFTGGSDGGYPFASLVLSGLTLYGTASTGGNTNNHGTVFSITFPPPRLTITPSVSNVVLTWPTDPFGFTLQSTTNFFPAVWSAVTPVPVVFNGQNLVINPATGAQQFYRLSQ